MKTPTNKQVVAELRSMIFGYKLSYKERDGKVRDAGALHAIACLKSAITIINAAPRFPNRAKRCF